MGATAQTMTTFAGTVVLSLQPGTTFNGNVTFAAPQLYLNGSTFNGTATLEKNGATDNTCFGNNTFNSTTTFTNSGSGYFLLAYNVLDIFNGDVTFTNTGTSLIYVAHNDASGTLFNGNIFVNSTAGSGIWFGENTGTSFLAATKTISIGGTGFSAGELRLRNFTQIGATVQTMTTFAGTAVLRLRSGTTFNGNVTFTAPQIYLNGATYNGTATIEKNGATENLSYGNNTFNGITSITNSGSGIMNLGYTVADDFNNDVVFKQQSSGALYPTYNTFSTFAGNISTVGSSNAISFALGVGGRVIIDGSVAQAFNGDVAQVPVVKRLTLANTAGAALTLNVPVLIAASGDLVLTTGNINTTATNVLQIGSYATVSGVSDVSYVSGPCRKIGDEAFTFPVGKGGFYRPISISAPGNATDHFTAEYFNNDANPTYNVNVKVGSIVHMSRCEYWILNRTNGASNVFVTLSWNMASTPTCEIDALSDLIVARWDNSQWQNHDNGAVTGNITSGTVRSAAVVSSFSPFTLASKTWNNPLPIDLLSFDAIKNGSKVDVSWTTVTETNNNYFTVERSADMVTVESVATVNGAGNSSRLLNYFTVDNNPLIGTSYYRLKQTDYDGKFKYFNWVAVDFNEKFSFSLYPNPVNANENFVLNMVGSDDNQSVLVVVYDAMGAEHFSKVIILEKDKKRAFTINPSHRLAAGVYIVSASSGNFIYKQKLIVK